MPILQDSNPNLNPKTTESDNKTSGCGDKRSFKNASHLVFYNKCCLWHPVIPDHNVSAHTNAVKVNDKKSITPVNNIILEHIIQYCFSQQHKYVSILCNINWLLHIIWIFFFKWGVMSILREVFLSDQGFLVFSILSKQEK